jgi:hypothetical protein
MKILDFKLNMKLAFDRFDNKFSTLNHTLIDWCIYDPNVINPDQIDSHIYAITFGLHMPIWCSYEDLLI